jgi:hypothetical protein
VFLNCGYRKSFGISIRFLCVSVQCDITPCYLQNASYLFTPWSRVLLEKLTDFQLVKKFPTFNATRRFITAFTSACQLSLSLAKSIQSIPPHSTSRRSILMLSTHLRSFKDKLIYTNILGYTQSDVAQKGICETKTYACIRTCSQ